MWNPAASLSQAEPFDSTQAARITAQMSVKTAYDRPYEVTKIDAETRTSRSVNGESWRRVQLPRALTAMCITRLWGNTRFEIRAGLARKQKSRFLEIEKIVVI